LLLIFQSRSGMPKCGGVLAGVKAEP
jgi:hypothetical protein